MSDTLVVAGALIYSVALALSIMGVILRWDNAWLPIVFGVGILGISLQVAGWM